MLPLTVMDPITDQYFSFPCLSRAFCHPIYNVTYCQLYVYQLAIPACELLHFLPVGVFQIIKFHFYQNLNIRSFN